MSMSSDRSGPIKGILKKEKHHKDPPSFEEPVKNAPDHDGGIQWDEMNILMTEHPADKDYGHMKIEEPKTPYHEMVPDEEGPSTSNAEMFSPDDLALKVKAASQTSQNVCEEEDSDSEDVTPEELKKHKKEFSEWRKKHYNEFYAVKRAKELMKQDMEELERMEREEENATSTMEEESMQQT